MERYICIHGHFYQPPRDNPWLEAVELQDSAYPYHDWNERITAECYAPNATSRILDEQSRIIEIVNNYARISFDFGPTLLSWLEHHSPVVYQAILDADRESLGRYGGHGSAMAQAYNHMILPLANRRDKVTQIVWGIRDFEHRFGRKPEGMWLPETAVDLETLELLAEFGITFTVLSPSQASRVRPIGKRSWRDVSGGRIDPSMVYRLKLKLGRQINLFFYDGPISRAVAFEDLLDRGENLANRIAGAFSPTRQWPQIIHIATDGETYGHHRRQGNMGLSYALHVIESKNLGRLTNYGEYLANHPPTHEVRIFEDSSWSCVHGVERWRSNCGCRSDTNRGWNQNWRRPLRDALDWLRDSLETCYEEMAGRLFQDPWAARSAYISVVLDRSPANIEVFLGTIAGRTLSADEKIMALKLLELQRHTMLMYTSCGWFFDELSGIETVQVIRYAGRALQLAQELSHESFEEPFLTLMERAKSNILEQRDGRHIYEKFVSPSKIDLQKVGAHYAISSLFDEEEPKTDIYCFSVEPDACKILVHGRARLAFGQATIRSAITLEMLRVSYCVLHMGDHNISGGVRAFRGEDSFDGFVEELTNLFEKGDLPEIIRGLDRTFGTGSYSLRELFRDAKRRILWQLLDSTLRETEDLYRHLYQDHAPLMRYVGDLGVPLPHSLKMAAEVTINIDLRRALEAESLDLETIRRLFSDSRAEGIRLDRDSLEFALRRKIESLSNQFRSRPADSSLLRRLDLAAGLARSLPLEVNLTQVQNDYYHILQTFYPRYAEDDDQGEDTRNWLELFTALGEKLSVRIDPPA